MKKVAIVGAGPSGMLAGIKIKELLGDKVNVVIYEKKVPTHKTKGCCDNQNQVRFNSGKFQMIE